MANYRKGNHLEFYPTPTHIGDILVEEMSKVIQNPSEILEPCAGDGSLVDVILSEYKTSILKYDIEPRREDIVEGDYLKMGLEYKEGRICIMNPPFAKATKFIKKALTECDYVACITSVNTIFSLDWDKYDLASENILVMKKEKFGDATIDCAIMVLKNKIG